MKPCRFLLLLPLLCTIVMADPAVIWRDSPRPAGTAKTPVCIDQCNENAARNSVAGQIRFSQEDVLERGWHSTPADIVCAATSSVRALTRTNSFSGQPMYLSFLELPWITCITSSATNAGSSIAVPSSSFIATTQSLFRSVRVARGAT